jgi:hypothetical protein
MSWHFSRALVEAFSEATCSDGEPSAQSSGSPTPQAYCSPDRMTACSRLSRFGMTFAPLTDARGEDLLTWFRAVFPVRTSASPGRAPASTASGPGCGRTWRGSLATFDRDTSSWRTAQQSLLGDSDECSVTWPRSGMTADGRCWELPMLGRRISGTGSGLLLPTPSASHCETRPAKTWNPKSQSGRSLGCMAATGMWPTPTVCGNYNKAGLSAKSGDGLATAVKNWPTPTATLGTKGGRVTPQKSREGGTLIEAVSSRMFATPTARDWRSGKASEATHAKNSRPLSEQIGGSLNPTWVEWLMGWPLGWTDCAPLATDKFRQWQQQHGGCLVSPESPAFQDADTTA